MEKKAVSEKEAAAIAFDEKIWGSFNDRGSEPSSVPSHGSSKQPAGILKGSKTSKGECFSARSNAHSRGHGPEVLG